jgi:addiction module RelE/StbE family toxin
VQLIWTTEAQADHDDIIGYIAERNPDAADRLKNLFDRSAKQLLEFPQIHRPGRIAGTREAIVHPNYLLIYNIERDAIVITAVLHARQQYP